MGWEIEDERTHAESIAPSFDTKKKEDVSFLVLRGPDVGKRFLVKPPGGVIGRDPKAVIQTRDPNISRRHAIIEFSADGRCMLTDLGSRNGVFINGVRISRAEVFDGNHVQLSNDTVMRARFQDPAETELLDKLAGATTRDPLTGLPNRRYVNERLAQEMTYARRHGEQVSIALIDIDDFKKVNDADGQAGGDKLLEGIAKLIRKQARQEDVIARYGGDEFVILLRNTGSEEAKTYATRIQKAVGKKAFDVGDVPIRASVTVGVATFGSGVKAEAEKRKALDVEDVRNFLDRADQALYTGKSAGKARVEVWHD